MYEYQEPAVPQAGLDLGEGAAADDPEQVANANREGACDSTCWAMTLCLICSVVGTIGAVVFFHFYNADEKALTRTCGEVTAWGQGYLKGKFESCLGSAMCLGSRCEEESAITCTSRIPYFEGRCHCCDWCLLRTLACLDKDHDRGSFHYCQTICKHL
ncbi:hypothetical protein MTO96_030810 [Rhipicephalus appendiculatus]